MTGREGGKGREGRGGKGRESGMRGPQAGRSRGPAIAKDGPGGSTMQCAQILLLRMSCCALRVVLFVGERNDKVIFAVPSLSLYRPLTAILTGTFLPLTMMSRVTVTRYDESARINAGGDLRSFFSSATNTRRHFSRNLGLRLVMKSTCSCIDA